MKKMKNISAVFDSKATVFFAAVAGTLLLLIFSGYLSPATVEVKEKITSNEKQGKELVRSPDFTTVNANSTGSHKVQCFDGYESWPQSGTFNPNAPWSVSFMYGGYRTSGLLSQNYTNDTTRYTFMNHFERDLNGDGLPDYIYLNRNSNVCIKECVYLSNGQGWSKAYQCVMRARNSGSSWTFYGDCAG